MSWHAPRRTVSAEEAMRGSPDYSRQIKAAKKKLREQPDVANKPFGFFLTLPPSNNDLYYPYVDRFGRPRLGLTRAGSRWKKEAGEIAWHEALQAGWKLCRHSKVVVEITVYWPDESRNRDTNNLHKALADALEGYIYENDKMALLQDMDFRVDAVRPRVELRVYQLEGK